MEVFTPDGTYSAFGDTYPLADFPTLVAAAPKGLFLVGPPVLELDGDEGTGQQPLCFVDQKTHDMRIGYYTDTYRRTELRLAAVDPVHDLPAQERRPGLGAGPRPDPARPHGRLMELDEFRSALDAWLDDARGRPRARSRGRRHPRRPDGPAGQGQAAHLRRRLDALGMARAGRRARGVHPAPRLPGRGADLPGPGRAGHLLDDRGAGPDHDRLRRAGAGRRHGAPPAAGRRDVVPGLLRAGHRAATWPPCPAGPPAHGDVWRVTGQKVWTSLAQYAQRCVLLTRTGTAESAHRGITALFVDMDSPGIDVRPIETMHGAPEFSEVFFDDVAVPLDRTLGEEGQGWSVAMDLLPFERSTALWHRAAYLHRRLQGLLDTVPPDALDPAAVGEVAQLLYALRARSRATQHRLAAGERLGPETSVDKVLVATAEQAVFDLVADGLGPERGRRRRPGQRPVAAGVPLLPGGHHLRRDGGDPAQHHRPSAARPRSRTGDGRRRARRCSRDPAPSRAARPRGGSRRRPRRARMARGPVGRPPPGGVVLFEQLGAANATASALDAVVGSRPRAEDRRLRRATVLPALGPTGAHRAGSPRGAVSSSAGWRRRHWPTPPPSGWWPTAGDRPLAVEVADRPI